MVTLTLVCALCGPADAPRPSLHLALEAVAISADPAQEPPAPPGTVATSGAPGEEPPAWRKAAAAALVGGALAGMPFAAWAVARNEGVSTRQFVGDGAGAALGLLVPEVIFYTLGVATGEDPHSAMEGAGFVTGILGYVAGMPLGIAAAERLAGRPVYWGPAFGGPFVASLAGVVALVGVAVVAQLVEHGTLRTKDDRGPAARSAKAGRGVRDHLGAIGTALMADVWLGSLAASGYAVGVPSSAPYLR